MTDNEVQGKLSIFAVHILMRKMQLILVIQEDWKFQEHESIGEVLMVVIPDSDEFSYSSLFEGNRRFIFFLKFLVATFSGVVVLIGYFLHPESGSRKLTPSKDSAKKKYSVSLSTSDTNHILMEIIICEQNWI